MISRTGTDKYMAPEMQANKSYDEKIDIWGAGCIMSHLLLGMIPNNGSEISHAQIHLETINEE